MVSEATKEAKQAIQAYCNEQVIKELLWVKSLFPDDLLEVNSWEMEERIIYRIKALKEGKDSL